MWFDDIAAAERADRDDDAETRGDIVRYRTELGLPVDEATVAHFLAEFKAERHDGGLWLTEAEAEEQDRLDALIAEAREVVDRYVAKHPEDVAGSWLGYGRPEYHVGFARNVEAHRQALMGLVPRRDVLHVHDFEYTEKELEAISERIADETDELAAEGLMWLGSGVDVEANRVEVEVAAADAATAEAILARRYGPAVTCTWLGREDFAVHQEPWQLWTLDESQRMLTVHYTAFSAFELDRAECDEDEHEVRVTVFVRAPNTVKTIGAAFEASVELAAPLGDRRVVDGATGRERERRIPREVLERSWELIRAYGAQHPDEYGGSWAAHPGCHVGFTARVDAHREALEQLLPEPRALIVHEVERTEAELLALRERVARDRGLLRREGIRCFEAPHLDSEENNIYVEVEAKDEEAARRILAERYGPALDVMWV